LRLAQQNQLMFAQSAMPDPDLNLLNALDVLLQERSVTRAALRLGLSTSAMSRTLSRLRKALGDPILAPAGRALVLTPHAEAIAEQVRTVRLGAQTVLRPPKPSTLRAWTASSPSAPTTPSRSSMRQG
jgi:DNA-binding transcriptional LysR family regulator